jgi:putative oxidoreductase
MSVPGHFKAGTIGYAAAHGVPMASFLVPMSGVIALLGGLSILLGFWGRCGGWLIVLFLVPVTLTMHNFWAVTDAAAAATQQIAFMKNLAMLGGALLIGYFGSGPVSIDNWLSARSGKGGDTGIALPRSSMKLLDDARDQ